MTIKDLYEILLTAHKYKTIGHKYSDISTLLAREATTHNVQELADFITNLDATKRNK